MEQVECCICIILLSEMLLRLDCLTRKPLLACSLSFFFTISLSPSDFHIYLRCPQTSAAKKGIFTALVGEVKIPIQHLFSLVQLQRQSHSSLHSLPLREGPASPQAPPPGLAKGISPISISCLAPGTWHTSGSGTLADSQSPCMKRPP